MYDPKKKKPYHSTKSQLVHVLIPPSKEKCSATADELQACGLVVDLSVVTRAIGAKYSKRAACFEDLVRSVLTHIIVSMGCQVGAQRIDIVADTYDPLSIKGPTRKERGSETAPRFHFDSSSRLPDHDMESFLRNDADKTDLNLLIANCAIHSSWSWEKDIVVTLRI